MRSCVSRSDWAHLREIYMTVVNIARMAVKTATKFTPLENGCPHIFDGPIDGQGNTVFQYAFKDSTVYSAKL
jgi:hypothetical protein